jgi:hypothetical protein
VRSGPGKNEQEPKKKKYSGQQQKEIDCDEPHPAPNEKTQPIRWTERPTGALVSANSLWPQEKDLTTGPSVIFYQFARRTGLGQRALKERLQYNVVFIWSHILDYVTKLQNTKTSILVHDSNLRSIC